MLNAEHMTYQKHQVLLLNSILLPTRMQIPCIGKVLVASLYGSANKCKYIILKRNGKASVF